MKLSDVQNLRGESLQTIISSTPKATFNEVTYWPITPMADFEALAKMFSRLVLVHGQETSMRWTKPGEVVSGWIVGIADTKESILNQAVTIGNSWEKNLV